MAGLADSQTDRHTNVTISVCLTRLQESDVLVTIDETAAADNWPVAIDGGGGLTGGRVGPQLKQIYEVFW